MDTRIENALLGDINIIIDRLEDRCKWAQLCYLRETEQLKIEYGQTDWKHEMEKAFAEITGLRRRLNQEMLKLIQIEQ